MDRDRPQHSFLHSITVGDLLKLGAAIVSISIAWGVFSTRLAIVELQQVRLNEDRDTIIADLNKLRSDLDDLKRSSIEYKYMIDDMWESQRGKLPPSRRN